MKKLLTTIACSLVAAGALGSTATDVRELYKPASGTKVRTERKTPLGKLSQQKQNSMLNENDDAQWVDMGTGRFKENLINSLYEYVPINTYNVQVQRDAAHPGIYRIVNPYENFPNREIPENYVTFIDGNDTYIVFDATDPEHVKVQMSLLPWEDCAPNYVVSIDQVYDQFPAVPTLEDAMSHLGKLENGIITFTDKLGLSLVEDGYAYSCNSGGEFKLVLPKEEAPKNQWTSLGKGKFTENLINSWYEEVPISTYEVEVEQDALNPTHYRIVNPYADYPNRAVAEQAGITFTDNGDTYIEFDTTDPEHVKVPMGLLPWEDGGPDYLASIEQVYDQFPALPTLEDAMERLGKFADGVITFTDKLGISLIEGGTAYLCNGGGEFKLVLPGYDPEPQPEWVSMGTGKFTEDIITSYYLVDPATYDVEIEQDLNNPGMYRLVNPYANYPHRQVAEIEGAIFDDENTTYIVVDATDPEHVKIPESQLAWREELPVYLASLDQIWDRMTDYAGNPIFTSEEQALETCGKLENGIISFSIPRSLGLIDGDDIWSCNSEGKVKIVFPGSEAPVDYDFTLTMAEAFCPDSQDNYHFTINGDDRIPAVKYAIVDNVDQSAIDAVASTGTAAAVGETVAVSVSDIKGRNLTVLFVAVDEAGAAQSSMRADLNVPGHDSDEWTDLGKADLTEGFLSAVFNDIDAETYEVDVQENKALPGYYRVVNPYNGWSHLAAFDHGHNHYLYIDASDPDNVVLQQSALGLSVGSYGEALITSDYYVIIESYGKDLADMLGFTSDGKMRDGVITFGTDADIKILLSGYGEWVYTNLKENPAGEDEDYLPGDFKLDLNKALSSVKGIEADSDNAPVEYYNLQGVKVDAPADGGVYIRRQGEKSSKVIMK